MATNIPFTPTTIFIIVLTEMTILMSLFKRFNTIVVTHASDASSFKFKKENQESHFCLCFFGSIVARKRRSSALALVVVTCTIVRCVQVLLLHTHIFPFLEKAKLVLTYLLGEYPWRPLRSKQINQRSKPKSVHALSGQTRTIYCQA